MSAQIMVPLDGSDFSEQALRYAYQLAWRMNAKLHLVKVQTRESVAAEALFVDSHGAGTRAADEQYLARIRDPGLLELKTEPATAVLKGPVVNALATYIRDQNIELVIMTTHGRGGLSRAWIGSVADKLIRRVNIPVLLLRPRKGETTRLGPGFELDHIVIPLDGSEESERAIEPALALGNLTWARYTLLQVVSPFMLIAASEAAPPQQQEEHYAELRANAARYLNRVAERLRAEGHLVDTAVVIQPQLAAGIIEQAVWTEASLIAMATHGRSGLQRLALGSVADKVMRGSTVPLLLLRPGHREVALSASA